ncbi:MAG: chemotaxis protein CheD [Gemmatimonadetes bacterium]|nr:chemotaxis protein CheD [Gemmatimonadota bacterium]MBI2536430.1 chemotaxis protein CheD [Gemmatimonadota bacterium]
MSVPAREIVVRMGEYAVVRDDGVLVALGLGSCVAVILHDRHACVAGLAHVVLPSASLSRDRDRPARAAETAVPLLVGAMKAEGADVARMAARLVGGASMFANLLVAGTVSMGERNTLAARAALRAAGIPIVGESVGETLGRSVWFDLRRGTAVIRSVGREDHVL